MWIDRSTRDARDASTLEHRWFNITATNLRKLKSQILSKPYTVQLGTQVLTNFEINLATSLLNFVRQAVPVLLVFLNYYRPGLLFADFGDAKTLVLLLTIIINYYYYP